MSDKQKHDFIKGLIWFYGILMGMAILASMDVIVEKLCNL